MNNNLSLEWNPEELEKAIISFEEIQGEINYKHAQNSLRNILSQLDLTETEQQGLESEIEHLAAMLDKLEQSVIQIVAFGMVGRGKSSVLNALLGQEIFQVGPLHGVTKTIDAASWLMEEETIGKQNQNVQRVSIVGSGKTQIQLVDTPGIDEIDGETRELLAKQIAKHSDLILFIISGDLTKVEFEALSQLREVGKPIILVFNKIDQYPEADQLAIYEKIKDDRVKELLSPDEIVMVAASPLITEAIKDENNNYKIRRVRGKPQIDTLKLKILDILDREGKSLVALNTMLYVDEIQEQLIERKMSIRDAAANQLIQKTVLTKAVAIALNPVTVIDLFSGAIIDVAMILALSRLYGISMTQEGAIQLLQKIALSMGGISASELLASLGLSSLKGLLGLSAPLTGGISLIPYLSIAITQAGVAGISTYTIGQVTKTYLAAGASWGQDGPKAVVKRILDSLDEESILNRIKAELSLKLRERIEN